MDVFDIPGAYLHTETDKEVSMLLEGQLADIMVKVAPKIYLKYETMISKGELLLYVKAKKSMYGLLRSALLFCRKLMKDLEAYGLHINL